MPQFRGIILVVDAACGIELACVRPRSTIRCGQGARRPRSRPRCSKPPEPYRAARTVALVLALDYAAANRGDLERSYDAKTGFGGVMKTLKES
jgi:hypothetical protein